MVYIPFLLTWPTDDTGQTTRQIFTRDGSDNAALRKGQTFLGTDIRS